MKYAQEFVENKQKNRCYPFKVSFDGDIHTQYFVLDAEDEKIVRENPNELMDCGVDWGKYIQLPNEFYDGVPACVLSADMNQPAGNFLKR